MRIGTRGRRLVGVRLSKWARGHAEGLLQPLGARWVHATAVAEHAANVGLILPADERDRLVAAGWLHDIGYAPQLAVTQFHPLDGARHLDDLGEHRLAGLVAHHTGATYEASLRGLGKELAAFVNEQSTVTAALAYCDITRGPNGERMSPDERLAEIERRHGPGSPVTEGLKAAWPAVLECVRLVEARLGEAGLRGLESRI
jgi:hypothetical protein